MCAGWDLSGMNGTGHSVISEGIIKRAGYIEELKHNWSAHNNNMKRLPESNQLWPHRGSALSVFIEFF